MWLLGDKSLPNPSRPPSKTLPYTDPTSLILNPKSKLRPGARRNFCHWPPLRPEAAEPGPPSFPRSSGFRVWGLGFRDLGV